MRVSNLIQTCDGWPSQWEFDTDHGKRGYVRYRWGTLWICLIGDNLGMIDLFVKRIGADPFDGVIEWDSVTPYVDAVVVTRDMNPVEPDQVVRVIKRRGIHINVADVSAERVRIVKPADESTE